MDKRQKKVKAELERAATLALSAENEKKQYITLQKEARGREIEKLRQAQQDADDLRKQLFQEVKAEADGAHVSWQKELAREKVLFSQQASDQVAAQFHHLAQRVFQDLADENFEERTAERFCALIANRDTEQEFFGQLQNSDALNVYSAFPLADSSQEMIKQALQLRLAVQPEIHFLLEPKLLGGILLSSDNHKLEWNIQHYLADFQSQLENTLFKDIN